jgi:dihydroorotase
VAAALSYRDRLQSLAPDVTFLMTLYLNKSTTPTTIAEAAQAGIVGLKAYPAGVTTNSEAGVFDFQSYYPVFEAMQAHDLVLNLHGEVPSTPPSDFLTAGSGDAVTVLNAETMFLPTLHKLHNDFPGEQAVDRIEIRIKITLTPEEKGCVSF